MEHQGHSGKLERVGRVGLPNEENGFAGKQSPSLEDRLLAIYEVWLV
jgi:hypothetical protein